MRAALRRELPELMAHLTQLGVELEDFLPAWLSSLFLSTLALDTAARVWDCWRRYFNLRAAVPEIPYVDPNRRYIVVQTPHSVFPMG